MAKNTKAVSAKTIRAAFTDGTLRVEDVKDDKGNPVNPASIVGKNGDGRVRGRIHPAFAKHYMAAHKGTEYREKSEAEQRSRDLTFHTKDKNGRKRKRTVTLPVSKVRDLAGKPGTRGRLSEADLKTAGENYAASLKA